MNQLFSAGPRFYCFCKHILKKYRFRKYSCSTAIICEGTGFKNALPNIFTKAESSTNARLLPSAVLLPICLLAIVYKFFILSPFIGE